MTAILGLILIFTVGYLAANLVVPQRTGERLGVSFLLGSCLFSLALFFGEKLGIGYYSLNSWLVLLGINLFFLVLNFVFHRLKYLNINWKSLPSNRLPLIILIFISFASFISNLSAPIKDWDAITLFDFRAQAFITTHSSEFLSSNSYFTLHNFYTTMMHYWFRLTGWFSPMVFYSLLFASFLTLAYFLFRRFLDGRRSLLFVLALALAPHFYENTFIAYTNLSYSIFLVLGAIYLYFWSKDLKWSDLVLGLFFSLMTVWVRKVEPLWLANLVLIPYFLLFRQKNKYLKLTVIFPVLIVLAYAKNHFSVIASFSPALLLNVISFLNWSVFSFYFPFFIIPVAIFVDQIIHKHLNREAFLLTLAHFTLIIVSSYGFASEMPGYWSGIPDTFRRLTLYWPLLAIFITSLSFLDKKTGSNKLK